jgi:hypothetical protein
MPDLSESGWELGKVHRLYECVITMQDGSVNHHHNIENSLLENGFLILIWEKSTRSYNTSNIVSYYLAEQVCEIKDKAIPLKKRGTSAS